MPTSTAVAAPERGVAPKRHRGLPWVVWRQHRVAALGTVVVLGGFGIWLVVTGVPMHASWARLGLNRCPNLLVASCQAASDKFMLQYGEWGTRLPQVLEFIPLVLGVFIGAPLVARELESGTYRFAWTQGRSRLRWSLAQLALTGGVLTVAALVFSALFSWWFGPWAQISGRMERNGAYEVAGLVFAARMLFTFTLGTFLGAVIRRTVPAMAATAAGFFAVAVPSALWLRPLIEKPLDLPANFAGPPQARILQGGLIVSEWYRNGSGHRVSEAQFNAILGRAEAAHPTTVDVGSFMRQHGYTSWLSYQPASRFWHFQSIEAAAYVLLAVALGLLTVRWVQRRAS